MTHQPEANDALSPQVDQTALGVPSPVIDKPDPLVGPGTGDVAVDVVNRRNPIADFFVSHPVGFWFFFWGEFAERSSYYGMRAILFLYMAEQMDLGEANASTFMALFV